MVDNSAIIGCRDHIAGVDSSAPSSCRLYRGMLLTGMTVRNTVFENFQRGSIVFSTLMFTPIGGHNPLVFKNVSTINVAHKHLVHLTNMVQGVESDLSATE